MISRLIGYENNCLFQLYVWLQSAKISFSIVVQDRGFTYCSGIYRLIIWLIKCCSVKARAVLKEILHCFGYGRTWSKPYLLDYFSKVHFSGLQIRINGCDYIPDLGLLLRLGGGYNAGLPTGLLFEPCLAVSFVLTVTMGLVLWGRAREALRAHNSGDVLLSTLPGLSNSLWYYPVGLLLLVL